MADMTELTHIPIQLLTPASGPSTYRAECPTHQWAVADGGYEAVEALVREHVREHPSVHCPSPPRMGRYRSGRQRWRIVQYMHEDGTSFWSGSCGVCADPRWDVFDSDEPVLEYMEQHWVTAHASKENHG